MKLIWLLIVTVCVLSLAVLLIAYICFHLTFYVTKKQKQVKEFDLPPGDEYVPYYNTMLNWMKEVKKIPFKEMKITSFDGLTLYGKYYEHSPDAPIELMFHGYRGNAERDLCGGVQRCFALGRNCLIVDQRASGKSEGKVISFGINESRDCMLWVDHLISVFGNEVEIILTGISMGASTVLIAAGEKLPKNIKFVLADCGYTSAKAIIKKVIKDIKLPAGAVYPFIKLGARLYGGFNLEQTSPIKSMEKCKVPVIFFHGEDDGFVPCYMSYENFAACKAKKMLITIPGADHGLSFPADEEKYLTALKEFESNLHKASNFKL